MLRLAITCGIMGAIMLSGPVADMVVDAQKIPEPEEATALVTWGAPTLEEGRVETYLLRWRTQGEREWTYETTTETRYVIDRDPCVPYCHVEVKVVTDTTVSTWSRRIVYPHTDRTNVPAPTVAPRCPRG